jgi:type I restriction enzyme, R subunit
MQAIAASELISFFQAIQASLRKLEGGNERLSNREIETAIRQVVDRALVSATEVFTEYKVSIVKIEICQNTSY